MTLYRLLELLREYNKRHNTPFYTIQLYDDGSCSVLDEHDKIVQNCHTIESLVLYLVM